MTKWNVCAAPMPAPGRTPCAARNSAARRKAGPCSRSSISRSGALTPEDARERNTPVMLVQGGIHAGEIDGKDAGFLATREMLHGQGRAACAASPSCSCSCRYSTWMATSASAAGTVPTRCGPEEMGWRTTGAESQSQSRLHQGGRARDAGDAAPAGCLGSRAVRRSARHRRRAVPARRGQPRGADLRGRPGAAARRPRAESRSSTHALGRARLAAARFLSLVSHDTTIPRPDSTSAPIPPRFSTGYWALRNRFALLVETHSWKDYPTRVRITRNTIVTLADMMARHGKAWRALTREADERATQSRRPRLSRSLTTTARTPPPSIFAAMPTRASLRPFPARSSRATTPRKPQIWRVPFLDTVVPKITVRAPRGGYLVPAAHAAWLAERLAVHGIAFERIERAVRNATWRRFARRRSRLPKARSKAAPPWSCNGQWQEERARSARRLAVRARSRSPGARLIMALLEPQSPDSYAPGASSTALRAEGIHGALCRRAGGAGNARARSGGSGGIQPKARLRGGLRKEPAAAPDFFYRRHSAWDRRYNLYPVYRVATRGLQ